MSFLSKEIKGRKNKEITAKNINITPKSLFGIDLRIP